MKTVRTIAELRLALEPAKARGDSLGLVPTMGALHEGHTSLFASSRAENGLTVATVFVNPAQFSDGDDLASYPDDLDHDVAIARAAGVDVLFAPPPAEIYPPGFATWIEPAGVALGLEGDHRPGHFRGVATVCVRLFGLVRPQRAYFGRKDAQQVAVVKQVVRDLQLDVEIRALPTVRAEDGVALSSRNVRLSEQQRIIARAIPAALSTRDAAAARAVLVAAGIEPEYVEVADLDGPTLAIAARVGSVRLIDNVLLEGAAR
ncbi:MAG: pantoate--beta-alanine ligase [Actinomycetes bacterium]